MEGQELETIEQSAQKEEMTIASLVKATSHIADVILELCVELSQKLHGKRLTKSMEKQINFFFKATNCWCKLLGVSWKLFVDIRNQQYEILIEKLRKLKKQNSQKYNQS